MPRTHRYNATEQKVIDMADRVIANPASTPSELLGAMRSLERVLAKAERRARRGADGPVELQPPAEPTVDELVSDLEKAQKPSLTNQQVTDHQNAENAAIAPPESAKALEVTQTAQGPVTEFCGFCSSVGPWNTRYPVGQADGILLCPACFSKMCAADMLNASAAAKAAAETPQDWAEPFAAQRHMYTSDFEKSRAIWAEQDRAAADQQEQERIERERAEAQYHAARARWIQDGGRL